MKWREWAKGPPSWTAIQCLNAAVIIWCGVFLVYETGRPQIIVYSALIGSSVASIFYARMIKFYQRSWRELMDMNHALLHDKVAMHIVRMEMDDDDDAPRPTLN